MEIKRFNIDILKPTDLFLRRSSLAFLESTFPLLREIEPPEVWEINHNFYIADGHNQIFDLYVRNKKEVTANYLSRANCKVGPEVYESIIDDIMKKRKIAERFRFNHVADLPII